MKILNCPFRGYCVEQSKKSCSSVRVWDVTKSTPGPDLDHFLERLWRQGEVWGSKTDPFWSRWENEGVATIFWIMLDWRVLVTSWPSYTNSPFGATLPCGCYLVIVGWKTTGLFKYSIDFVRNIMQELSVFSEVVPTFRALSFCQQNNFFWGALTFLFSNIKKSSAIRTHRETHESVFSWNIHAKGP